MTESEAIKELKEDIALYDNETTRLDASIGTPDRNLIDALEMAIQALEKQIPKKPILKNGESRSFVDYENGYGEYKVTKWQDWVCPICGWFVGQRYNRSQNHSHDQRKCNYCNECGQKLDWSDENDD